MKISETNVLRFPAHQEQRRHMTNNAHKEALVSGNLTWEPQTNTMIYATNKESERCYHNNSTRPPLSPPHLLGERSYIMDLQTHWPRARVELSLQMALFIMGQWSGTNSNTFPFFTLLPGLSRPNSD